MVIWVWNFAFRLNWKEDNFGWKMTYYGTKYLMEDDL